MTLYKIKVERDEEEETILNAERCLWNARNRIETSIIIDANILIDIRNSYLKIGAFDLSGISELRSLLAGSLTGASISPGLAIREIPDHLREDCIYFFDLFTAKIGYIDHPTATRSTTPMEGKLLLFHELPERERLSGALPYYMIAKMRLVNYLHKKETPEEKYKIFQESVLDDIDLMSALELEIAKFCFCDIDRHYKGETGYDNYCKKYIQNIKKNFIQNNKSSTFEEELRHISNATRDLQYINFMKYIDGRYVNNFKQDVWFLTFDAKLAGMFNNIFYPSPALQQKLGNFSCSDAVANNLRWKFCMVKRPPELSEKHYWRVVDSAHHKTLESRNSSNSIPPDANRLPAKIDKNSRTTLDDIRRLLERRRDSAFPQ